ncbi:hypothetical protein BT93_D1267 [Corymbia citriodora subsp. variegata]|nr:hypothetical protein BT93_D1267 [Corymbia citriodora subsp. variegata]
MKPIFAFIFLSSLLLFAEVNDARKSPGDYWKKIMKDQPMPEPIRDLIRLRNEENAIKFVRDFDTGPNVIIYHSHGDAKEKKHCRENVEEGEDERLKMRDDQDQKEMTSA